MTPNDIEILIHCYVSPMPHPRLDAPAVEESISRMIDDGLLVVVDSTCFQATDKGEAHIRQLCNLPYPEQAWIDQNGKVIENDA